MVFDQPKVFEVIKTVGEESVLRQIEFELVCLADLMSVGGNLKEAQILFIARQLIEMYPNESIADFKLCFQRGAMGLYGDIQRMDGITIGKWMAAYLDEKYQVLETKLMKEKELTPFEPVVNKIDVDGLLEKYKDDLKEVKVNQVPKLSKREIFEEGQQNPKPTEYPASSKNEVIIHHLHLEYIKQNYDARTGEKLKGWVSEDEWLKRVL